MSYLSKIIVCLGIGKADTYRHVEVETGSYSTYATVRFNRPVDSLDESQLREILKACQKARRMRAAARKLDV